MSVKNFREGIRLVPVSADPSSPVEGQLQYSDGTARDEGVYVFTNGAWTNVGGSIIAEPKDIILDNPKFEVDTTGWTFIGSGSITRDSIDPLAGDGSLEVTTNASETLGTYPADPLAVTRANGDTVSHDFTLDNLVERGQNILVNFDLLPVDPAVTYVVDVFDVDTSTLLDGVLLFRGNALGVEYTADELHEVSLKFQPINDTSINYRLIIYSLSILIT